MSKKLTILFDANPLVNGSKSGVGYYTQNLIQSLADTYPDDVRLIGHYFSFLGRKDDLPLPSAPNISYVRSRIIPGKILSFTRIFGFQLPLELFFRRKGDAALFTNFVALPSVSNIPRLVTVHDLCYIDVPQYVAEKNRKFLHKFVPKSIKSSVRVMAISEATKHAIQHHYNTPDEKFIITPIPPGTKDASNSFDLKSIGVDGKFILFVSTLEPRKNVINLVKGYALLPESIKKEYLLVLAGGTGWYMGETMQLISDLQAKGERIVTTGYVSNDCRAALYEQASLLALPSHYEGFGMPILEAMNYGVPTVVSDIPVFHEVAGDASEYMDKDDPKSITNTIIKVLENPGLQKELISKGNARLESYDWPSVAKTVFEAIKESVD